MIKIIKFTLPCHWACALMYNDLTGLSDDEEEALNKFIKDGLKLEGATMFHCVSVSSDVNFAKHHDASQYGILACDVALFTFQIA